MKDLEALYKKGLKIVQDAGIPIGNIKSCTVNKRLNKILGRATQLTSRTFKIEISERVLNDSLSDDTTMSTILHEIIHCYSSRMDHGPIWQSAANKVAKIAKVNIERTACEAEMSDLNANAPIPYKYVIRCKDCGEEWHRMKASRLTKHPEFYHCSCGGALTCKSNI